VSTLRAAVVGAGHLGRHHARLYAGADGVELLARMARRRLRMPVF
jgi:predicted dehydrogenase